MGGKRKPELIPPNPEEIAAFTEHLTYHGFLRDICERPEDDAPRLILADWLDDLDTVESRLRAWFIRWQIEHHSNAYEVQTEETKTALHFYKRKSGVQPRWRLWSGGMADLLNVPYRDSVTWRRGFICRANTTYSRWWSLDAGCKAVLLQPLEDAMVYDRRPQWTPIPITARRVEARYRWLFNNEPPGSPVQFTLAVDESLKPWCGGEFKNIVDAANALSAGLIALARQSAGLPWKVQ